MTNIETTIILGAVMVCGIFLFLWSRAEIAASVVLVGGIAAVAIVVMSLQVGDYHARQAALAQQSEGQPPSVSFSPPTADIPRPMMGSSAPTFGGPKGAAAPPATRSPYAGG